MKKYFAIFAVVAGLAAFGAEDDSYTANRKWVREQLTELRQQMGLSTATVETRIEGGQTNYVIRSAFTSPDNTNCVAISFTVSPCVLTAAEPVRKRGLLRAEPNSEYTVSVTMHAGSWFDKWGREVHFNFNPDGWVLEAPEKLPAIPSSQHTCVLDSNCVCEGYGINLDDVETPAEYKSLTREDKAYYVNILNWIDTDTWEPKRKLPNGTYIYQIEDSDGNLWNIEDIACSDAWVDALLTSFESANEHLSACRVAYFTSLICTESNPQHNWYTQTCGPYTWSVCRNNSSHKEGSEHHDEHDTGKVAKAGNTGWTQRIYCTCGKKDVQKNHNCKHVKCAACSAGDDCDWACPTCNGNHDFGSGSASRCKRCRCAGCGLTEAGATGYRHFDGHGGWGCCSDHPTGEGEQRSNGKHCLCECGDWDCYLYVADANGNIVSRTLNGDTHKRTALNPTEYAPYSNNGNIDPSQHWIIEYSDCERCGDLYGTLEEHAFPEDGTWEWLSNTECGLKKICGKCKYEKKQKPGDENVAEHSKGGENVKPISCVEDGEICRKYYECVKCHGTFYEDGAHERGENCLCANNCGHEFEHSYKANACGISKCEYCNRLEDSSTVPQHTGWSDNGDMTHTCACEEVTEGHAIVQGATIETDMGFTATLTCAKNCGFEIVSSHTHHFTNCGVCDANDGTNVCNTVCTGCDGAHVFGSVGSTTCAKCECPTCSDCNMHPAGMDYHTGWHACGQDVEDGNYYDGTEAGIHCQCQCGAYGHYYGNNIELAHTYQTPSGGETCENMGEEGHVRDEGRCVRCPKKKQTFEEHTLEDKPYKYATGMAGIGDEHPPCLWYYKCTGEGCSYEDTQEHGHDFDAGTQRVETSGGVSTIITTFKCENCPYEYDDETEVPCYHKEVIIDGNGTPSFGASYIVNCECTNCHTNWFPHKFGTPQNREGQCPIATCVRENCTVETNTVEGVHAFITYNGDELKSHTCICELKTEPCSMTETNGVYSCTFITVCAAPPKGCGHEFKELERHEPDIVVCGSNVFCKGCGRKRVAVDGGGYEWVAAGEDQHSWGGKPQEERTACVCDCGLVTAHYYAPDRTTCGCECGGELSHIRGSDPTCKCTGEPSHAKVLIGHGTTTRTEQDIARQCPSPCGKSYTDKKYIYTCDVCGEIARTQVVPGSHECVLGYTVTAGELTYTIAGYTWPDSTTGEDKEVEAVSETVSWSGGGFGCAPADGNRVPAAGTITAGGATILIRSSGTYWLRAKIDDSGSVSVGGLTASGPYWGYGTPVSGYLSAGTVSVSAGVDSVGGPCSFDYQLSGPSDTKPEGW